MLVLKMSDVRNCFIVCLTKVKIYFIIIGLLMIAYNYKERRNWGEGRVWPKDIL